MPTFSLAQMASDGNYPSATGTSLSMSSVRDANFANQVFAMIDLIIAGTPGTGSPSYQVQVKETSTDDWVNCPNLLLNGAGSVSARSLGVAWRLVAANGTTPGTGANTPRYLMNIRTLNARGSGF